ncbi:MAG: acyl carrier protein [Thermoguttaceae bacterium]|nr:acyl carrier protein [Thermoguttaceae bacterium]MDW8077834.1 acyl carrier protein [Thermoguttaceae bacterium]
MPTREEIFQKVKTVLMEALAVDEDEVRPEATLVGDLGAESIDFLDIAFRLEKAFDIKIPRGELFPEDILTNDKYVQDGKLTPAGLEELRRRMPYTNLDQFAKNPAVQEFANFLTVEDICRFVERKLAAAQAAGTV